MHIHMIWIGILLIQWYMKWNGIMFQSSSRKASVRNASMVVFASTKLSFLSNGEWGNDQSIEQVGDPLYPL